MIKDISSVTEFRHEVVLRDGSEILIRPLRYDDKTKYLTMFNCLSRETKFLRYHYVKLHLSEKEVEDSCTLDYRDRIALIAEKQLPSSTRIIGIGRLDRIGNTSTAEIAFLVDDIEQGKGICTYLLRDLTEVAKKLGYKRLVGLLTNENVIMLDIIRKFTSNLEIEVDGSDILVSFDI